MTKPIIGEFRDAAPSGPSPGILTRGEANKKPPRDVSRQMVARRKSRPSR